MEAMSTSHDAQMELMNVELALLVTAPAVIHPAVKVGAGGAGLSFHPGLHGPPPVFQAMDPRIAEGKGCGVEPQEYLETTVEEQGPLRAWQSSSIGHGWGQIAFNCVG